METSVENRQSHFGWFQAMKQMILLCYKRRDRPSKK